MKTLPVLASLVLLSQTAHAAIDLRTRMSGPTTNVVDQPGQYQVLVDSLGSTTQTSTVLSVYLPIGATLSQLTTGCTISDKYVISCALGTMPTGDLRTITFTMSAPAPLRNFVLAASVKGRSLEYATGNNTARLTLNVAAPAVNQITIVGPRNARIDACTFRANFPVDFTLCSYSSVVGYDLVLDAGGVVLIQGTPYGVWDQPNTQQLHIAIADGQGGVQAEYLGAAVSPTCFEGEVVFPGNTAYHSAFHACLR